MATLHRYQRFIRLGECSDCGIVSNHCFAANNHCFGWFTSVLWVSTVVHQCFEYHRIQCTAVRSCVPASWVNRREPPSGDANHRHGCACMPVSAWPGAVYSLSLSRRGARGTMGRGPRHCGIQCRRRRCYIATAARPISARAPLSASR